VKDGALQALGRRTGGPRRLLWFVWAVQEARGQPPRAV